MILKTEFRKCAVMQPTYLSWSGYFNLIINSDVFVFLDDVQYSKNSFFSRNRYPYKNKEGFQYLAAPIRKNALDQKINESFFVEEEKWRKKHLSTIRHIYSKHPFFKDFFPILEKSLVDESLKTLAALSIDVTKGICDYLKLKKNFHISSELNIHGNRSERLVSFCKNFDCGIYISPIGAKGYIEEDNVLPVSDVKVVYQKFIPKEYYQRGMDQFIPYMSMIDVIFNLGPELSLEYVKDPI